MSQLINSNISGSLVRENVTVGSPIETVFREAQLLNFFRAMGRVRAWRGGQPQQWNLATAANSSVETFVEGQAPPQAGKQTYARASLVPFYVRGVAGVSGHVMDQVRQGGVYADPVADALQRGTIDVLKKFEDSLVGSTADQGIQSVIDSGDTYANLAPGSNTTHASIETGVSGALSFSVLEDNIETGATAAMANPTHILSCQNQITNYVRLAGSSATTSLMRFGQDARDFGTGDQNMYLSGSMSYQGRPWVGISGLTTTVILLLDMNDDIAVEMFRDVTVEPFAKTDDGWNAQISLAGAIVCKTRRRHIKLTGVNA